MLKIYHYDEKKHEITFRVEAEEGIKIISMILSRLYDSFYVDWLYALEEIHEKSSILFKKVDIKVVNGKNKNYIVISNSSKENQIFAIIPV